MHACRLAIVDGFRPNKTSAEQNEAAADKGSACKTDKDCIAYCRPQCKSKNCVKGLCLCGCAAAATP
ncbi:UNVERIFIED_CONTAM: hypothetical protein Slati_4500000 [Sesamum latifolium]|uniref:Uncharacterized protein n=1 Tax=Sesamum latifolium TaxID=2727402 RepID=A0AAW2SSH0_9LAMI